ncbi:ACT domain-containing protein [Mariniphaga sp.]|uniref:ACT domain-containing protein n=1 Tax=Mariniphaga sp. TaxID=1954475 RepID=UPI0035625E99
MKAKQVSVFLENKSGRLNEVAQILGEANINISAFTVADTSDFGVLRLIVSDPDKACNVLKEKHFSVRTTDVVLVKSPNQPGALSRMLQILNAEGVFIEYLYAFSMNDKTAVIVIRPANLDKCLSVLENHKNELSAGDDQYQL